MASRMGLVRGDLVVGKKQFSPLLKTIYPTVVTAQNIKAGFRKAGIFPLSRGAVDTTQPPSSTHATLTHTSSTQPTDTTSATPSTTQTPCPSCNRVAPKNYLVAAGIIPESLANVLMSPALERKEKVRRRIPLSAQWYHLDQEAIDEWVQCDLCHLFHLQCTGVEQVPDTANSCKHTHIM
ncbi:hypothetical protein ABG768_018929 [Culter alburnus]|uniref:Uncharacterized protein n=1 Tax=Culter alburnus TaxID=194366 RepID=A0AAW2AVQ4_CULAL